MLSRLKCQTPIAVDRSGHVWAGMGEAIDPKVTICGNPSPHSSRRHTGFLSYGLQSVDPSLGVIDDSNV